MQQYRMRKGKRSLHYGSRSERAITVGMHEEPRATRGLSGVTGTKGMTTGAEQTVTTARSGADAWRGLKSQCEGAS